MFALSINFSGTQLQYNLVFKDFKEAQQNYQRLIAMNKDDPHGLFEITDDYGRKACFMPVGVLAFIITDVAQETECHGYREIIIAKVQMKIREVANKDPEIQKAQARAHAQQKLAGTFGNSIVT